MASTKLHTENIQGSGKMARWPYDTSLPSDEQYATVMKRVKDKEGYTFKGWKFNGNVYQEPFSDENTNPFGPISGNTDIKTVWTALLVFCKCVKTNISNSGETIKVTYNAITDSVITSSDVKLFIDDTRTTMSYTKGSSDSVEGNQRVCTITIAANSSTAEKKMVLYAEYNNVKSSELVLTQS